MLLACPLDTDLVYLIGRPDIKTPEQLKENRPRLRVWVRAFTSTCARP